MRLNRQQVIEQLQQHNQSKSGGSSTEQTDYDSLTDQELQETYVDSGLFERNYPENSSDDIEGFDR